MKTASYTIGVDTTDDFGYCTYCLIKYQDGVIKVLKEKTMPMADRGTFDQEVAELAKEYNAVIHKEI